MPFLLLTCSKISCLAVTSFSNRSIFFINLLTCSGWGVGEVDASVNVSVHTLVHFSPHLVFLFLLQSLFQLHFLLTQLSDQTDNNRNKSRHTTTHTMHTQILLKTHSTDNKEAEEGRLVKVLLDFSMYVCCTHI